MDAVFLSDALYNRSFGHGRYIGPYAVSSKLRSNGWRTLVIDYFQSHPDLFGALARILNQDTLVVGISSTFLSPRVQLSSWRNAYDSMEQYLHGELHAPDSSQLKAWLHQLKSIVNQRSPRAKIVLGGAKALRPFYNPEDYDDIDYICLGAGEEAIQELMNTLKKGGRTSSRYPSWLQSP